MKIKGKVINFNSTFSAEISFEDNIKTVNKIEEKMENIIIPGYVDLHCHGGNG